MKPNSVRSSVNQSAKPALALLSSIIALSAGTASAATYQWLGTTDSTWGTSTNWNATGVAPTGGTFSHRININNAANSPAVYSADLGNTTYTPADRGLVIGSGTGNGTLTITGGKLSTVGAGGGDAFGNTNFSGTLILDGGDYETGRTLDFGLTFTGVRSTLTINNGTATIPDFSINNSVGTINLNGGTLAVNRFIHAGGGQTSLNFNGGTLKARTSSTAFYSIPGNGNAFSVVKSGGAVIDTNGFDITIAPPLTEDPLSTGGGLTKNGNGTLTLSSPTNITGNVIVNGGGLNLTSNFTTSWQPASITHNGTAMGINMGVYIPGDPTPIVVPNLSLNSSNITLTISGSNFPVSSEIKILDYTNKTGTGSLQLNTAALPVNMVATLEENTIDGYYYLNVTTASASYFNWSGNSSTPGSGVWDTTSQHWNTYNSVYAEPALANFPATSSASTVNVASDVSPYSITLANTSGNYTFTGTGKITGATTIEKSGAGIVTFDGAAHNYSGNLTISGGAIIKKKADDTTGNITVAADNITFALDGGVTDGAGQTLFISGRGANGANYFFSGSTALRGALQSLTGANTWAGDIVMALNDVNNPNRVGVQNGASLTLTGNITENVSGASIVFRAGNLGNNITLSGPSTYGYTGRSLLFSGGASIILGANNKLPAVSNVVMDSGGATIFDLNGFNQECGSLSGSAIGASAARILNNNASTPSTLTVNTPTGVSGFFQGSLASGTGILSLVKSGNGTQTLSQANTYTGNTTIQAGRLELGGGAGSATLSPSSQIINNGIFAINRNNAVTQGTDFANNITGTGRLIKENSGSTLTLTSANSYSGNTTVSAGTLSLSGNGTVGTGQVVLASGTTFNVTAATPATISLVGGLSGNGTVNATGKTLSIGGVFAPVSQTITGNVTLTSNTTTSLIAGPSQITSSQLAITGTLLNAGALQINSSANSTFTSGGNITFMTTTPSGGITPGFNAVSVGGLALSAGSPGVWSGTSGNLTFTYNEANAALTVATVQFTALQTWRQQFFGSTDNSGNGADLIDFDNDGLVNLMEYALGTDPTVASPNEVTIGRDGNFLTLTYPRRSPADPALTYTVQGSSDLTTGFTPGTGSTASGSPSVYTDNVDVSAPGSRRFLRLSVTYTPTP